jgi:sulfonate dioxygenase
VDGYLSQRTSTVLWHSDVTYEKQPPGTTFLYALDVPATGGDTLFANAAEAYKRLSPAFQQRLHGLKAVHSGIEQANNSVVRGGVKRREPIYNEHPVVRTHPVTGEKAIYVNPGCKFPRFNGMVWRGMAWLTSELVTREIVGFKKEESDALLRFLYDHLALGADFHVRVRWEPGTVVVWDNRVTQHSAIVDWATGERRHLARITPQAEVPFETPFSQ